MRYYQVIAQPKEAIALFVATRIGHAIPQFGHFSALGLARGDELIAGVIYTNWEAQNVCAHAAAIEGRHWLTPAFLYAIFDYPFNQEGRRRITCPIPKKNTNARQFAESCGFRVEGVLPHYFERDALVIYGLLREKCRFIEQRTERKVA